MPSLLSKRSKNNYGAGVSSSDLFRVNSREEDAEVLNDNAASTPNLLGVRSEHNGSGAASPRQHRATSPNLSAAGTNGHSNGRSTPSGNVLYPGQADVNPYSSLRSAPVKGQSPYMMESAGQGGSRSTLRLDRPEAMHGRDTSQESGKMATDYAIDRPQAGTSQTTLDTRSLGRRLLTPLRDLDLAADHHHGRETSMSSYKNGTGSLSAGSAGLQRQPSFARSIAGGSRYNGLGPRTSGGGASFMTDATSFAQGEADAPVIPLYGYTPIAHELQLDVVQAELVVRVCAEQIRSRGECGARRKTE